MRFALLSEGGFQVVYPLGLWSRLSKLSNSCSNVAITLVYIYSTFTLTLYYITYTYVALTSTFTSTSTLKSMLTLKLPFKITFTLTFVFTFTFIFTAAGFSSQMRPLRSARLTLSRGRQHSPAVCGSARATCSLHLHRRQNTACSEERLECRWCSGCRRSWSCRGRAP